ncbi:hypothetical protein D0T12_23705 [Actinomadura spongiicola]|uniref:Uncharacterized protein n=1 Tax=Actinomadura spongiicola TaxID=2303421 RepID=A0A372GCX4_9ACTN|nr:hypothetical protein [Actinomadura spongiicola]RFS83167.1 hypothetical protein D0T12_23705 [Actinomadura spongiicola]
MTMRRMLMMAGGAVLPVAVLTLLLNNQWVVDAIRESDFQFDEGIGPLVLWSHSLAWRFNPQPGVDWSTVLIADFTVVLFFVLLALFVVGAGRTIDQNRGPLGALIVGWWAAILAGGATGLVYGVLAHWTDDFLPTTLSQAVFTGLARGAAAGLAFGWLPGLGAVGGFVFGRPRAATTQQPYGGQQYPRQQAYAPQQHGMQMQPHPMQQMPPQQHMQQPPMQPHPSAVPYVPPQGQPQQQPWGAAPAQQPPGVPAQQPGAHVPQQPGPPVPQQFGAPPTPPQQPAPPQQPEAPQQPQAGPKADTPEPDEAAQEPPADSSDGDDLDLADRTVIDRRRDEE